MLLKNASPRRNKALIECKQMSICRGRIISQFQSSRNTVHLNMTHLQEISIFSISICLENNENRGNIRLVNIFLIDICKPTRAKNCEARPIDAFRTKKGRKKDDSVHKCTLATVWVEGGWSCSLILINNYNQTIFTHQTQDQQVTNGETLRWATGRPHVFPMEGT